MNGLMPLLLQVRHREGADAHIREKSHTADSTCSSASHDAYSKDCWMSSRSK
jgi:hypothetical protein